LGILEKAKDVKNNRTKTDTGRRIENIKVLEIIALKELGKMTL